MTTKKSAKTELPKARGKIEPRGSLKAATQRSREAATKLLDQLPAEDAVPAIDSPFMTTPRLYSNIRMFSVEITYKLNLHRKNPVLDLIAEATKGDHHMQTITVFGNVDIDYPEYEPFPTHQELETSKTLSPASVVDEVARYYGNVAAHRLVEESNDTISIVAVSVSEQMVAPLVLDLTNS